VFMERKAGCGFGKFSQICEKRTLWSRILFV